LKRDYGILKKWERGKLLPSGITLLHIMNTPDYSYMEEQSSITAIKK
jgi:hypothetical protein